jgi:hypothetical protein
VDYIFIKASREPQPTRCLGVTLLPLTVGHFFVLREFDSAFISGEQASIEDLIFACFVCCQDPAAAKRSLRSWLLPIAMRLWGWRAVKCNLAREMMTFRSYIRDGTAAPRTVISMGGDDSMRELNSPMEWRLLVMLMVDFHLTEREAMATTVIKANALWATLGDRDGKINLVSERTEALLAAAENGRAE